MINLENISFDHCLKCTVCTVYCPVARVTHAYPGPKQSGPDAERLRIKNPELIDGSIQYCNNCKRCEIACPSDVKIADIIQRAKWKYLRKKFRLRDFILSRTDLMGSIATPVGPIVNFFLQRFLVKFLLDLIFKIPKKKSLPKYSWKTFDQWFKKNSTRQNEFKKSVVYFHGCYVNYNDPDLGKAVITVLNTMGIGVGLIDEKCCGVPLIANSYFDKAKENGTFNIHSLTKAIEKTDTKIVSTSSTCLFALKYEYPNVLDLDNSVIAGHLEYISEFIYKQFQKGNIPKMRNMHIKAVYHSPCHLERMGGVFFTIGMLGKIPGLKLTVLHTECCGISGTYGFKKEYYRIAQDIGSDIFKQIESLEPDIVVTDCETCKWQIEMNTPYKVVHPIVLIAQALFT